YMSGYMLSREPDSTNPNKYIGRSAPLYSPSAAAGDYVNSHGDMISNKTGTISASERSINEASHATNSPSEEGEHSGKTGTVSESETAFTRSSTGVGSDGVARGGFGGAEGEGGAHGIGGEAGGAHGFGGAHGGGGE